MKQILSILLTIAFVVQGLHSQSKVIDVDGFSIHVETSGIELRKPNEPVIIYESPSLGTIRDWDSIFFKSAEIAPVIRYDRSGLGQSEWNQIKPSPENIANHLFDILKTLDIEPPYVLVGHSWGTQLVRRFAHLYPEETGGLVLIDPGMRPSTMKAAFKEIGYPSDKGLQEYIDLIQEKNEQFNFTDTQWENLNAMGDWFASPNLPPTPKIPVAALLAGKHGPGPPGLEQFSYDFKLWNRALFHHEMERLVNWTLESPDGIFIIADQSGHFVQHDEPELVLMAIQYVVDKSKLRD